MADKMTTQAVQTQPNEIHCGPERVADLAGHLHLMHWLVTEKAKLEAHPAYVRQAMVDVRHEPWRLVGG